NLSTLERFNTQFRLNSEKQIRAREQRQELARLLDSMTLLANVPAPPLPIMRSTAGPAPVVAAPTQVDPTTARLYKLRQDLAEARNRYKDTYPDVIALRTEVEALEREVAARRETAAREAAAREAAAASGPREAAPVTAPSTAPRERVALPDPMVMQLQQSLSQLDADLRSLKEEENNLRTAMTMYQNRVENTPKRDLEFQELSRDYDSTRDLYRTLLKRFEEAQLSESLEQRQKGEQFRILEAAVTPTTPAAPRRARFLGLSFALACGLAAGLVVLVEQLDTSFHSIEELRAFSAAPVLVGIPRIVTAADVRRRRWRGRLAALATVCGLVLIVGASYFIARGNEQLLRLLTPGA